MNEAGELGTIWAEGMGGCEVVNGGALLEMLEMLELLELF